MSSARLISLIAAWRENRLTVDEAVELNRLLRANEDARRAFRAEAEMHGLLHCAATAVAMANASELAAGTTPIGRAEGFTGWLKRNLLLATAAGLCVGIGSASAAWAIAQRPPIEAQARGIPIADPSFETSRGRVTSGFPYGPGAWSGDEAEAVERSDLPSADGTRALRFLKAEIDARLARPPCRATCFNWSTSAPLVLSSKPARKPPWSSPLTFWIRGQSPGQRCVSQSRSCCLLEIQRKSTGTGRRPWTMCLAPVSTTMTVPMDRRVNGTD